MIDMIFRQHNQSRRQTGGLCFRAILAGLGLCLTAIARGQDVAPPIPHPPADTSPQAIDQPKPAFYVHAEADRQSLEYYNEEQISIKVRCEVDAFIYVLYTQVDGKTYVVFPNSATPDNRVKAMQTVQLPNANDTFRWTVSAPFGKEQLKVVASKDRVPTLEKPEFRRNSLTPVTGKDVASVVQQLKKEIPAENWSEVSLELTTHDGVNPNSPYFGKRYGVFFAIPKQLQSDYIEMAKLNTTPTSNLGGGPLCDAYLMRRTLNRKGGLDDYRMYPDANNVAPTFPFKFMMREAVTQWLPSVSKPGDTVVIYFSGHGADVEDKTAPGGKYHFLVPVDSFGPMGIIALRKMKSENRLSDAPLGEQMLAQAEGWLREANLEFDPTGEAWEKMTPAERDELVEKVVHLLTRKSCVTEDEFGHWLQALPGRRIVVILDACRSGGFYPTNQSGSTKSIRGQFTMVQKAPVGEFTFLKGQLGRLKSLGQVNTAMLAATHSDENSIQGHQNPTNGGQRQPASDALSDVQQELAATETYGKIIPVTGPKNFEVIGVFTYYLTNSLLKSVGPVDVESAGVACAAQMDAYFKSPEFQQSQSDGAKPGESEPKKFKAHAPVFFDNCRPRVLLKP